MSTLDECNPQILDAVRSTNATVLGLARAQSLALTYQGLAGSLNLMMLNSVQNQFGMQKVEVAVVAATCAQILKAGGGGEETKRSAAAQQQQPAQQQQAEQQHSRQSQQPRPPRHTEQR